MMDRDGIAEEVGAIAEHRDRLSPRRGELCAEYGAGAPAEARRGARTKIAVGLLERAMFEQERVLVDDDCVGVFGLTHAAADPGGVERRPLSCPFKRRLPLGHDRRALLRNSIARAANARFIGTAG